MIFYLRKKYSETEKDKELIEYAMEMQPAISLLVSVSLLWPWLSPTRFPSCFVGGCSDFLLLPGAFTVLPVKSPTGVWKMRPCTHTTPLWHGRDAQQSWKWENSPSITPRSWSLLFWSRALTQPGRQQSLTCLNSAELSWWYRTRETEADKYLSHLICMWAEINI